MRTILADQDAPRRAALRAELERHGHDVVEVGTAREVLAEASRDAGLVVLGWQIGEDTGIELCRGVRAAANEDEPVVVLVGSRDEVDAQEAVMAGAADVWAVTAESTDGVGIRLSLALHYARLQAENLRVGGEFTLMRRALDLTHTGFVLTDPRLEDHPIVYASEAFLEMTGYPASDVLGRNCRFLQGPDTDPADIAKLRRGVAERLPVTVEIANHRKDGSTFYNEVHVAPVRDDSGDVVRFVGVQVDVSAYRAQERRFALEQQARRAAEAAERRSAFLAAASPTLDARLDLRATMDSLAQLSVPDLADVCLVETVEHGRAHRVATSASDPALERLLNDLDPTYPLDADGPEPLARALRQGRAEVLSDSPTPVVDEAVSALIERRFGSGVAHRWMLVPLRTRGRSIGVLILGALDEAREFGIEELALAEDVARRAALALDNARLYEQQVEVARVLQASFLPSALPAVPGIDLATRFRPADITVDIGGDFYDVVALDDGSTAITVGDVTGKGAAAAALTGLCRHTLRTAWLYETCPEAVMRALNRVLVSERRDRGRYATATICVLDHLPDGVEVRAVSAGHPAPRILRADGTVDVLQTRGSILGWHEELALELVHDRLGPGDTLVCFTDGVSAGHDGGPLSEAGLAAELAACHGADAAGIATRLQAAALRAQAGRPTDDVVIVAAQADASTGGVARASRAAA